MTKYITIKLTAQQFWQVKELTRQEIKRLERIILERTEQGKSNNATFGHSVAFNKRLATTLAAAEDEGWVRDDNIDPQELGLAKS